MSATSSGALAVLALSIGGLSAPAGATPPTVEFSTYLGGGIADQAWAIAVDADGNSYVAGYTASDDFPTLDAFQPTAGGQGDAFVAKFDPDGDLVFSTYLGGSYLDYATSIAVDATGAVHVAGQLQQLSLDERRTRVPLLLRQHHLCQLPGLHAVLAYVLFRQPRRHVEVGRILLVRLF